MTTKTKAADEPEVGDRTPYIEPTPMSRQEVIQRNLEQDERRRERKAGKVGAAAKAKQRVLAQGPKPLTQEEIDEMEVERIAVRRKREKAGEERRATGLARIAAEIRPLA